MVTVLEAQHRLHKDVTLARTRVSMVTVLEAQHRLHKDVTPARTRVPMVTVHRSYSTAPSHAHRPSRCPTHQHLTVPPVTSS